MSNNRQAAPNGNGNAPEQALGLEPKYPGAIIGYGWIDQKGLLNITWPVGYREPLRALSSKAMLSQVCDGEWIHLVVH